MKTAGRHPIIIRNIQTSNGVVQYNIYDFLKEMKNKPVIWNRMHIDHKNGAISEENWKKFAKIFVPFLEQLDEDEKTQIIDELKNYWNLLRKGMMKSILTAKKGKSNQCHYLHYMEFFLNSKKKYLKDFTTEKELQRLAENEIKFRAMAGLPPPENTNNNRARENNKTNKSSSSKETKTDDSPKPSGSKRAIVDVSPDDFIDLMSMCETTSQQTTDDEVAVQNIGMVGTFDYHQQQQINNIRMQRFVDESAAIASADLTDKADAANQAFFESIKPTLRNLNDSQKLEFKIQVLKTLKKYKLY